MAANTAPIFTATPSIQWTDSMSIANTTKDMTTGSAYLTFTAGVSGSFVQRLRFRTLGTNVASVARVWINNGQSTASFTNNTLWDELSLPATTVTETAAQSNYELPLNFALPSNYRLYITLGTGVAAGWDAIAVGGDY